MTLSDSLQRYGANKPDTYLPAYERILELKRTAPLSVLELGVQSGASLLMWADYLPNAQVTGVDLNDCSITHPRISFHRGYQQDTAFLQAMALEVAPNGFDLIIDDASHLGEYTAASFDALFYEHLKPGGVYALEDWGTGYWPTWPDGAAIAARGRRHIGRLEGVRRSLQKFSRPVAESLRRHPRLYRPIEEHYGRLEALVSQKNFENHDAGMVGFTKQLLDLTSTRFLEGERDARPPEIREMWVADGQVFCIKQG